MAAGELGDLASRATNTATNVKDSHALLDANRMREIVLMPGNSLVERLAIREFAKVEGLAPSILVNVGGEVVVAGPSMLAPDTSATQKLV